MKVITWLGDVAAGVGDCVTTDVTRTTELVDGVMMDVVTAVEVAVGWAAEVAASLEV